MLKWLSKPKSSGPDTVPYSHRAHYDTVVSWWHGWNLPSSPKSFLPLGYVARNAKQEPICAGFLYQLGNTPMFWIEGIVSNPEASKEDRKDALVRLITALTKEAKDRGCEMLLGSTPRDSLAAIYGECGFGAAPEKYLHVGRRL